MEDFFDDLADRVFWRLENFCDDTGHRYCNVLMGLWHPLGWVYRWAFKRVTR